MTEPVYAVWDCETTGIDTENDRIVQFFFALADKDGNILEAREWLINPGIPMNEDAAKITGLTDEYLAERGMHPSEAFDQISVAFENAPLDIIHVAYNLNFDLSILSAELARHVDDDSFGRYMARDEKLFDPYITDRFNDKYRKGKRKLSDLAAHYRISVDETRLHDAAYDVELTAKVAVKVREKYGLPTTKMQTAWYAEWATGLEEYLRKSDPTVNVNKGWPLREKETH